MVTTNYLRKWNYKEFKTYTEINHFIQELKKRLIGKSLDEFWIMGIDFNDRSDDHLELDEPISLIIGDIHLEIDYSDSSTARIGINSLKMNEYSYHTKNNNWHKAPKKFLKDIINKKIVDIIVQQRFTPPTIEDPFLEEDRTDLYSAIGIEFENKQCLIINALIDFMKIKVEPSNISILKPMDCQLKLIYSKDPSVKNTNYNITCPYCGSKAISKYIYGNINKQIELDLWNGKALLSKSKKTKNSPEFLCCICGKNFSVKSKNG